MKIIAGNPYIKEDGKKIYIDALALNDLITKFETPFMVFIENKIRKNINNFNNVFNNIFQDYESFYSLKANYLSDISKIISSENMGAEVISLPELKVALNNGYPSENIIVGGPYLPDDLIEKSLKNSIKEIIIYDLDDLERVNKLAEKFNITQDICLRINSMKYESKLGTRINQNTSKGIASLFSKYKNLNLTTLLSHYGTQMNHVNQFLENLDILINSIKTLKDYNVDVKNINLGGGFPEATVMPKKQLKKITNELKSSMRENDLDVQKIYAEPGRYIVGDAAVFVANVIKVSQKRWIFINIGNHICPKFARCSLRFYNASKIDAAHKYKTNIAGIIPTDQDVLAKNYFFTDKIELNDKILITNVGAYCLTFSNRFPYRLPTILRVKDNDYDVIFNPENQNDFSI